MVNKSRLDGGLVEGSWLAGGIANFWLWDMSREAINRVCNSSQKLGVKMTPTIEGWTLNEINLLSVSSIRCIRRESGIKGQVIS